MRLTTTLIFTATILAGCSSSTEPARLHIDGTYTLRAINSGALPFTLAADGQGPLQVVQASTWAVSTGAGDSTVHYVESGTSRSSTGAQTPYSWGFTYRLTQSAAAATRFDLYSGTQFVGSVDFDGAGMATWNRQITIQKTLQNFAYLYRQ